MTDEEIKAIEMIKEQKEQVEYGINAMEVNPEDYNECVYNDFVQWNKAAETVLNLIQKQKEKIKILNEGIKRQNKQIDLMAEEILYENNCSGKLDFEIYKDKEEVIKDFERKVKNEN